jgi:CHAT domain-containing protein
LVLAPDGDLSLVPFEALPVAPGRRLIDEYEISYVAVGRDVLRFSIPIGRSGPAVVVADPDFDLHGAGPAASGPGVLRDLEEGGGGPPFSRLPGTRIEGEAIAALLGVRPWLEGAALKGPLRNCCSPRVLHLATHGFFLADQPRDPNRAFRDLDLGDKATSAETGRLLLADGGDALLRSGLALSGANTWLRRGGLPPAAENGLLTAEDVTGLDLSATELVVLSACETGLGEVQIGEGVFGLRRSFALAGRGRW